MVTRLFGQFVEVELVTTSTCPVVKAGVTEALMGEPKQFVSTLFVPELSVTEGAVKQFVVFVVQCTVKETDVLAVP